jgi:hypothetical protein
MPRIAGYQNPVNRASMLDALRRGATREQAAGAIGAQLITMLGWIDRDPVFAHEVEEAERGAPPREARAPDRSGDRWARIHEEAATLGKGLVGYLLAVESRLQAAGFPAMSPWWLFAASEFYASGKQEWLIRGARGLGKSTTLCRPTVVECLFGEHYVNPGEVAIWPLLSVDMDEANLKVGVLEKALSAVGLPPSELTKIRREQGRTKLCFGDAADMAIEIRVYPATVNAVSGPTMAGATDDEEAKWRSDRDKGTNSAEEVLDAMGPAFRGRANAHHIRCSSAYRKCGPHYDDIEAGPTETRHIARIGEQFLGIARAGFEEVAAAIEATRPGDAATIRAYAATLTADSPNIPTHVGNPTISALSTWRRARNVRVWLREYGSVSTDEGDDDGTFFDPALLDAATAIEARGEGPYFAALDPGSRRNACALAIVRRIDVGSSRRFWQPVVLREWIPTPGRPLDLREVVLPEAARLCQALGVVRWVSDAHALTDVEIVGAEHGISTRCRAEGDAHEAEYRPVRDALHRGECPLTGCHGASELVRQLRLVRSVAGQLGHTRIVVADDGPLHGDLQRAYVSACADAGAGAPRASTGGIKTLPSRYGRVDPRRAC